MLIHNRTNFTAVLTVAVAAVADLVLHLLHSMGMVVPAECRSLPTI